MEGGEADEEREEDGEVRKEERGEARVWSCRGEGSR